ncbi:hypothetical protein NQ318_010048 [Aromia moschata]|uniref:Uncharacterized protein n=1 Tax=Aromia moschata TaxID=1265417 RepID=A0AAV8X397_9CUCU|nr:hypothetical protein NQ318_010048 [Aromia moschata]
MKINVSSTSLSKVETSYPTAVFCIIATEFCERFSFCGLRTSALRACCDKFELNELEVCGDTFPTLSSLDKPMGRSV